jgi:hypothetical protein
VRASSEQRDPCDEASGASSSSDGDFRVASGRAPLRLSPTLPDLSAALGHGDALACRSHCHWRMSPGSTYNPVQVATQAVAKFLGLSPKVDIVGAQSAALRACVEAMPGFDPRSDGAQGYFFRVAFEATARHLKNA